MKKKMKGKIKKNNFYQKFNKNEKGIKNVTSLLNLIYDNNINTNFKCGVGRTIYESAFNLKNIQEIPEDIQALSRYRSFAAKVRIPKA